MTNIEEKSIARLEIKDFLMISEYIQQHYGIQLPHTKLKMVEARLHKRLNVLNIPSYKLYFDYVFGEKGRIEEYFYMIDLITTNKTDFFREPSHFDFLSNELLPGLMLKKLANEPTRIWSAACSSGEEVYSILVTIEEFILRTNKKFQYKILGSDLSIQVLKKAASAVYPEEKISSLPAHIKKRYFLKSVDKTPIRAKVKPSYLSNVEFKRVNLLKQFDGVDKQFDIIFCRNVLIYFNKETQILVISKLLERLAIGGFLFIGHSESLTQMDFPLKQIQPTVYQKISL